MTELRKPISRRAVHEFAHYKRRIVVELLPGDVIAMRLERTPRTHAYSGRIEDIFRVLAQWYAIAERARKREARRRK
jgi:hypothetical protein